MKPIELEISGWGPYKQLEKIDFTELWERGLFLVTGPTGAGKTTIFDAISFALYGNLSGQMREKNSVRSDFADRDTKTYVRLKMQHKGQVYEIYRNPEYLRPKKRKTGTQEYTKERENAILTMPDGTCMEGAGEVTKKMQEILSLDYRQFKQVSMIAQGEFTRLLTETPNEKIKIFRELFGTSMLEQFTANLRAKANRLYKEVMEYRHRMDEDMKLLHEESEEWKELTEKTDRNYEEVFQYLEEVKTKYKKQKKDVDKAYEKLEKEEKNLSLEIAEIVRENVLLEKLEKKEEQLLTLKEQEPLYQEKERIAVQIRKAQIAEPDYIRFKNSTEQLEKQKEMLERLSFEQKEIREKLENNRFFHENKELLSDLAEAEKESEKYKAEKDKKIIDLQKKQAELEKKQTEYLLVEKEVKEARECLERAEEEYQRSAIGIVAKMLKPEKPCPVCGSLEHPNPAVAESVLMDEKQLKELREQYDFVNGKMLKAHEKALFVQAEVKSLKAELENIEDALKQSEHEVRNKKETVIQAEENKPFFEVWFRLSADEQRSQLEQKTSAYVKAQALLTEKEATANDAGLEMGELSVKVTELEKVYKQVILQHDLKDEQTFLELIERKSEEAVLTEECRHFKEQLKSMADLVNHLKEEVNGCTGLQVCDGKKQKTDTKELEDKLKQSEAEKKEISKLRMEIGQKISEITKIRQALKEKQEKQETLSKEYGIVKDLDNLASGNNVKRLVFEQYVLAVYFEQVLEAANVRFDKMTAGRYEMFRSEEVADGRSKDSLEICVMDYYTGKSRPVKTLSGGETFKASLALALGLSDVIGRTNGGIRVETLFIDEGFGALDSESLEQACETLTSLVEKERLIGIISHVPELRERIENQIVIRKTNSGSRIQNVVG
ncbi:MAG: SMC family ATPase [Lachnospiraceae bacterium]|nr:SMC family ATPase [Lachnospiraceae bacterium]